MSTVTMGLQGVPMATSSGAEVSALGLSPVPRGHRWAALVVLCAAALIVNVDNTILNVALPTLVRRLAATSSELQWIVDSYAIVFAGLLLVGGSLADRFGRKRFFLIGLGVFGAGSIGAAFSSSVDLLIEWRAVMGAGAALTIPASLSIVNDLFRDPAERARAIGAWAATIGLGIAVGPITGGLLLARFWWGSVFLVNVPIVVAGFAGALLLVPDSKNPAADPPDPWGAVLSIAGLGLLLWAIIEAPARGWGSAEVVGAALASLAVLGAFVAWEARSRHPMLKLGFFSDRRFSVAAAAEVLGVFGLLGALFALTQFLQFDLALSPLQAGLRILPMAAVLGLSAWCRRSSAASSGSSSPWPPAWRRSRAVCGRPPRCPRLLRPTQTWCPASSWSGWEPVSCCRRRRTPSWDRSRRATPGWDQPPTPWRCRSAARWGSP